jgi:hypothetical protein
MPLAWGRGPVGTRSSHVHTPLAALDTSDAGCLYSPTHKLNNQRRSGSVSILGQLGQWGPARPFSKSGFCIVRRYFSRAWDRWRMLRHCVNILVQFTLCRQRAPASAVDSGLLGGGGHVSSILNSSCKWHSRAPSVLPWWPIAPRRYKGLRASTVDVRIAMTFPTANHAGALFPLPCSRNTRPPSSTFGVLLPVLFPISHLSQVLLSPLSRNQHHPSRISCLRHLQLLDHLEATHA